MQSLVEHATICAISNTHFIYTLIEAAKYSSFNNLIRTDMSSISKGLIYQPSQKKHT